MKCRLKDDTWLLGVVVRVRPRKTVTTPGAAKGKGSQKNAGKSKTDGREGIHLCGGTTPSDVILLERWESLVTVAAMKRVAVVGQSIKFTDLDIKNHNEKTIPWSTSRLPFYGTIDSRTRYEPVAEVNPDWLEYHPLTPVRSLRFLQEYALSCVVGKVLPPQPTKKSEIVAGVAVNVSNFSIKNGDDVISLNAWREQADLPPDLEVGSFYMFQAVKKITKKGSIELRYTTLTEQKICPDVLHDEMVTMTQDTMEGATLWTQNSGAQRDFTNLLAHWYTLAAVDLICSGDQRRKLQGNAQVPSVFISCNGAITYEACATCPKAMGVDGMKKCRCTSNETVCRWKGRLLLTDSTCQVIATGFDVLQQLVLTYADDDDDKKEAKYYHENPERVDLLMAYFSSIPYTCILSFEDNDFSKKSSCTCGWQTRRSGPRRTVVLATHLSRFCVVSLLLYPVHLAL
jgi:RNA polymerase subunit RPABC4/transcription elongation factor Spt4